MCLDAARGSGPCPHGGARSRRGRCRARDNPVYVDTNAERALADDEVDELRAAIRGANTPIYIAVLPASAADGAGGDPDEVARQLAEAVGRPGTFGVVVGDSFRAGSSELPAGRAAELAAESLSASGDDTLAVLAGLRRIA